MSFNYSVYIPRVFKGITQGQISGTFHGLDLGKVGRVDLLKVFNEKNVWVYNKAFVHFDSWKTNSIALALKKEIESGSGKAVVCYEGERFWMLLPNASEKVPSEEQNNTQDIDMKVYGPGDSRGDLSEATMRMMVPPPHTMYMAPLHYGIPHHIMMNPYSYMEPPPNYDRPSYFTNYTSAHHEYFSQFPQMNSAQHHQQWPPNQN